MTQCSGEVRRMDRELIVLVGLWLMLFGLWSVSWYRRHRQLCPACQKGRLRYLGWINDTFRGNIHSWQCPACAARFRREMCEQLLKRDTDSPGGATNGRQG